MEATADPRPCISILLVEDEEAILQLLVTILDKKFPDLSLYTASNGKAGLELFTIHRADIVITDIKMPVMGGVQMADKIRAIKPDTKFIVLSGNQEKFVPQDSVESKFEFEHNIVKPVKLGLLFAAIEKCLGEIARDQSL